LASRIFLDIDSIKGKVVRTPAAPDLNGGIAAYNANKARMLAAFGMKVHLDGIYSGKLTGSDYDFWRISCIMLGAKSEIQFTLILITKSCQSIMTAFCYFYPSL